MYLRHRTMTASFVLLNQKVTYQDIFHLHLPEQQSLLHKQNLAYPVHLSSASCRPLIDGDPTSTFWTDFAMANWCSEFFITTKNTNRTRRGLIKFATIFDGRMLLGSEIWNWSYFNLWKRLLMTRILISILLLIIFDKYL